jgi:hypothetical protein
MRRTDASTWVVDYSAARAQALRWLGDRYLLARPINASHYRSGQPTPGILMTGSAEAASPPSGRGT